MAATRLSPDRMAGTGSRSPVPMALRLPCPPPSPPLVDEFGLLLRRLAMLRGLQELRGLEPDAVLALLERCASSEQEHHAIRAFLPLVANGMLQLIDCSGAEHDSLCASIARQVTIRPSQVAEIAAGLRASLQPAARSVPAESIEKLALAGAARSALQPVHNPYNSKIWMGLLALGGLALAGASLLAFGVGNRLAERRGRTTAAPPRNTLASPAPSLPAAPRPAPSPPAASTPVSSLSAPPVSLPSAADGAAEPSTPWPGCASLPTRFEAAGRWAVLAPLNALRDVQLHCRSDARPYGPGVLLARFDQRSAAEQLASALSEQSGLTFQVASVAAP